LFDAIAGTPKEARFNIGRASPMKSKRHSPAEISAKLEQAQTLATAGKLQSEIAKALGVSIMTLHRWRKLDHADASGPSAASDVGRGARGGPGGRGQEDMMAALQLENRQLRQIVMDLLLEKIRLEEAAGLRAA
jgi:putative transposase